MSATAIQVEGFTHHPGRHCGSTALRNLLAFHGAELSEEMCLGLGAGACFYYGRVPGGSPSRFVAGRSAALERDFVNVTGAPFQWSKFESADASWAAARAAIDAADPPLLITDIYHLDHYGSSAHFPGHAVVLAGYDDERAYVADTAFDELQATSIENLGKARHSETPMTKLHGYMLTRAEGPLDPERLVEHAPAAMALAARRMLEPEMGAYQGLPALRIYAEEVGRWGQEAEDWRWSARFSYQVFERRGSGGGNFRRLYGGFLDEVGSPHAALAHASAERWTSLSGALHQVSDLEEPDAGDWDRVAASAADVLAAEERLWAAIAEAT